MSSSFEYPQASIADIEQEITATLQAHGDRLRDAEATNSTFQLTSPNGHTVGLNRGRIGQFY